MDLHITAQHEQDIELDSLQARTPDGDPVEDDPNHIP